MIPFNRPTIAPGQLEAVAAVFESRHMAGDGAATHRASGMLADLHCGARVLLTTSCTAALEMSALLAGVGSGDEVIVPSFTFVSTANAFALVGARVVFADLDPETLNVSDGQVAELVSDRTRAIVAVNYGGHPAVTADLAAAADRCGAMLIEDNAHGLFGHDGDVPLGTRSSLSTLSFHETKNVTCGEGGALVINDPALVERAEVVREKGTNRTQFFRGLADKYTWVDLGSSYLMSDVNAAVLGAQLEFRDTIQARRRDAARFYERELARWADDNGVRLLPHEAGSPHHLFGIVLPDAPTRTRFLAETRADGVATTFHYLPLHESAAGRRFGTAPLGCPLTTDASARLARLPLYSDLRPDETERIAEVVARFRA